MRRFAMLANLALVLCCAGPAGAGEAPWIPAGSHLVVGAKPAALADKLKEWSAEMQKLPIFVRHPQIAQQVAAQTNLAFTMASAASVQVGFDPTKDVEAAWLGVVIEKEGEPAWALSVMGNLPAGVVERLPNAGTPTKIAGRKARRSGDQYTLQAPDGQLLLGNQRGIELALKGGRRGILPRLDDGQLLAVDFSPPGWLVDHLYSQKDARMFMPLLDGLRRVRLEVGKRSEISVQAGRTALGAWQMILEGIKEGLEGGHRLVRAYAKFFLALDLTAMPEVPPQFRELLRDKQALAETIDVLLPPRPGQGTVATGAGRVTFSASQSALAGAGFIGGILAAVAIPAFIDYTRKAKLTEGYANIQELVRLEHAYRKRHKRYLACKPHPRQVPRGQAVAWGRSRCFKRLGFNPGKTYFSYSIRLVGKRGFEIEARADIDGDGIPVTLRQLSDGGPVTRMPPDEW